MNECQGQTHGCTHPVAECVNTIGGFFCRCQNGYLGNGTHCEGKCGLFISYWDGTGRHADSRGIASWQSHTHTHTHTHTYTHTIYIVHVLTYMFMHTHDIHTLTEIMPHTHTHDMHTHTHTHTPCTHIQMWMSVIWTSTTVFKVPVVSTVLAPLHASVTMN